MTFNELPVESNETPGSTSTLPVASYENNARSFSVFVKPFRSVSTHSDETKEEQEPQMVQMSLIQDLRYRLDKRILSPEDLATLAPEMAELDDGSGCCRPQCMVCLDELHDGQQLSRQACGHTFHHECMATWLVSQLQNKQVGACPHCKYAIVVPVISCAPEQPASSQDVRQHSNIPTATTRRRRGCFSAFTFNIRFPLQALGRGR